MLPCLPVGRLFPWSVSPPCIAYLPSLRHLLRHCVKCCMFGTGRMLAYLWCVILSHLLSILLNSNHELSFNIGRHVSEHYSMHTGLILSVVSAIHWGGGGNFLMHGLLCLHVGPSVAELMRPQFGVQLGMEWGPFPDEPREHATSWCLPRLLVSLSVDLLNLDE